MVGRFARSLVDELGGTLLEERADGLGDALAERRHDLLAVLVLDRGLLGGDLEGAPHAALGQAHAPRRERGDLLGGLHGAREQLLVSTTSATRPMRSASSASKRRPVSISSCERETPIRRGSSQLVPMSQLDRPMLMKAARNTACGGGVADVAAEAEREPEAGGGAVDGGDDGLRQRAQAEHELGHVLLVVEAVARQIAFVVGGRGAVAAQVDAGAEAAPGAGEDHRAARAIERDPAQLSCIASHSSAFIALSWSGRLSDELHDVRRGLARRVRGVSSRGHPMSCVRLARV